MIIAIVEYIFLIGMFLGMVTFAASALLTLTTSSADPLRCCLDRLIQGPMPFHSQ